MSSIRAFRFTRKPSINIIGFVHVRDMFELDEADRQGRRSDELMRPIRFVPETKPVNDLLREMQHDGAHMAIVIDEYGNTAGLATMEDMVEEILGEIHDEHEPERDVQQESDGSFVVAGSLDLDRLGRSAGFRPRGRDRVHHHRAAWLRNGWGTCRSVGERLERDGIRIEVLAGDELKSGTSSRLESVNPKPCSRPLMSEIRRHPRPASSPSSAGRTPANPRC